MDIIASSAVSTNPIAIFSMGTLFGMTTVYCLNKLRNRQIPPETVPAEETFEFPDPRDEYRLVMGIRNDLKMQKGKVAAQCGHAAVAAYAKALKHKPRTLARWMQFGGTKIAVKLDTEQELLQLEKIAKTNDVLTSIIRDAGQTQVAPGSRTVIAIGPASKSTLEKITGHLKLY